MNERVDKGIQAEGIQAEGFGTSNSDLQSSPLNPFSLLNPFGLNPSRFPYRLDIDS